MWHKRVLALALGVLAGACSDDDSSPVDAGPDGRPDGGCILRLERVEPSRGPVTGGTQVELQGECFEEGMSVLFGAAPAASVTVVSAGEARCVTPPASQAGPVTVVVELPDGRSAQLVGGFEYEDATQAQVSWCRLQHPPNTTTQENVATEPIYGRVYAEGVTDQPGQGAGIRAELGYGPEGTDPATSSDWSWVSASFNVDVDQGANDEYQATLQVPQAGRYDYAYRFALGDQDWVYCDLNGSDDGYSPDHAGKLTVEGGQPTVDWCILQYPPSLAVSLGQSTELVFGQVFEPGVTPGPGAGAGIVAEAGFGPAGTDPSADPSAWTWVTAAYNDGGPTGDNDEYMASFLPDSPGSFSYVYRFSLEGGPWVYCDLDGPPFEPAKAGTMTVSQDATELVDWCNLQWPPDLTATAGQPTDNIYGRVYEAGVTQGQGQGPGILAQVGWGPDGSDPATDPNWRWVDATYNVDVDGLQPGDLANDEYMGSLTVDQPGTYDFAYRFSADNGLSWRYCDRNGSDDGYSADQAGSLVVQSP